MQQHLMQMQPMMAAYYPNNVTSDHIQQYLDENKSLILKIVESQNSGKLSECAENQARLQRNLMYLAAIADSQPQPPAVHSQYSSSGIMQAGGHNYTQHQQPQQMTQQSLMAARSSMLYTQQPFSALHQQQQAAAALHSHQLGMSSSGSSGLHMMQNEPNNGGGGNGPLGSGGGFPDFGLGTSGGGKHDLGLSGSGERRGGSSGGHNDDHGGENLYLKGGDDN